MSSPFIHLHLHTEYSVHDSIIRIQNLIEKARIFNMPALAITDSANLFGAVKFYRAALAAGIKPIIGSDLYIENDKDPQHPFRMVVLCQDKIGYQNLIQLISRSYLENQHHGKPIIKRSWFSMLSWGLIALSNRESDIGQALLLDNLSLAQRHLAEWGALFPNRFYLELQKINHPQEAFYQKQIIKLVEHSPVPLVATNDVRFLESNDFEAHEARVCIQDGWLLDDPRRPHRYTEQQYFRSSDEMTALWTDFPEALENSKEIAKRCNLTLPLDQVFLPHFPLPSNQNSIENYFKSRVSQGFENRLAHLLDMQSPNFSQQRLPYDQRLQKEMEVIHTMDYEGYFLIVSDFVQWAKDHDIPVGPGRGSGAGSLVAYALGITAIDPLQYDLLFERFLNPKRVSLPDLDIDFCMKGRDRVIEYVSQKYGRKNVSQIITYGAMAARAVVRDVGRILGYGYGYVDKIAKLIPFALGIKLEDALTQEPLLKSLYEQEEEIRVLIDLAKKLEGLVRNIGKNASGVVIAPSPLTDFTPLYCEASGANLVTQFDKEDVDAIGLVKFDFLGLRTLTIIADALRSINQKRKQSGESPIDIEQIALNDPSVYQLMKSCQVTAVFQLESRSMKDLVRRLQPDCFEDVIALVALIRPGPSQSGMVDDFINRKHGKAPIEYLHPRLTSVLKSTYGVILYQEQVMQIAQILAGYNLGEADLLRRAMGKKKPKEMAKQRKIFIEGAVKQSVRESVAQSIFDLMEKFAGYGFNKSHSAAYALITYQTAWLKTHYPIDYMAAVLSADMDNTDKLVLMIDECKRMGIPILPPDINQSDYAFTVKENKILYGLGALKGVGLHSIESIVSERNKNGPFKNLFELCSRLDSQKVSRKTLEVLIKAGALDSLDTHRANLFASLKNALSRAAKSHLDQSQGQMDFLDHLSNSNETMQTPAYVETTAWTNQQSLDYEKEVLGYYLTAHPIQAHGAELKKLSCLSLEKIAMVSSEQTVRLGGLIKNIRIVNTRKGTRMAFVTLSDLSHQIEVALFSELFETYRQQLVIDQIVILEGRVAYSGANSELRVSATAFFTLEQAREHYAQHLLIRITSEQSSPVLIEQLAEILKRYRGGHCPVVIRYVRKDMEVAIPFGKDWKIKLSNQLLQELAHLSSQVDVKIEYT